MLNVFNYQGKCRRTESYPQTILLAEISMKQQKQQNHISAVMIVYIISAGVHFAHIKTPRFSGEKNGLCI